ncbi:MAG: bifunctional folylpolyglutamate synthase/dihydrofolate synthase [Arenicellaceae bacterium]|nr:bifunctional folylpolyglutamate synthase/dihydrofolate synthase [Arenicellaceae bacterium]
MLDSQNIDVWIDHMQSLHPQEMEFSLDRPQKVFERLRLTDRLPYLITVAGTNGKGSCVELLTQAFRCADIPVGSYTSPHLIRFTERIRVNGVEVSDALLIFAFMEVEKARENEPLTFFEFTSLAAFIVFSNAGLDVLVLEAGLGGRLDVMNLLDADALLLTNIALDHTKLLGDTRELIGFEKAGLLRNRQLVVCGDRDLPQTVVERADVVEVQILLLGQDFDFLDKDGDFLLVDTNGGTLTDLLTTPFSGGLEQLDNAACVVKLLKAQQCFDIPDSALEKAFSCAIISGRKQVLSDRPLIVLDVAHNEDSVRALSRFLRDFSIAGRVYAIFGMLADKSVVPALEHIVEYVDNWFIVELDSPRAFSAGGLEECLNQAANSRNVTARIMGRGDSVELWEEVMKILKDDDLLIVFGSFLLVGDILAHQSVTE